MTTPLDNAYEAVDVLRELLTTPMLRSLHFEFDISVENPVPIMTYKVERFVYKRKDEVEE